MNRNERTSTLEKLRWGLVHAETIAWERYFCVKTRKRTVRGATRVPAECIEYEPLPFIVIRRAIRALELKADDVFLDYGAGLGRALLMAARFPLKRVVGVELLEPLADLAMQNVRSARRRLRSPVQVIAADAATWEVPDDVTIAYLFNPFVGAVMDAVQARMHDSLKRRPRQLRVLYAHADDQPDLFAARDWLQLKRRVPGGLFNALNVAIYESAA